VKQPLSLIGSIKTKFAIVILAAIGTAVVTSQVGYAFGWPIWLRPIVAAALSLIAVYFFARGLTRPLRDMAAASLSIARGNYDQRVHTASVDEVGQLAQAFNSMAADLAEVERNRKELVANVSHELRTPIAGLRATLENIADGVAEPTPETINAMLERVGRLQRLVTDLLDFIESPCISHHWSPLRLTTANATIPPRCCRRRLPTTRLCWPTRNDFIRSWRTCSTTACGTAGHGLRFPHTSVHLAMLRLWFPTMVLASRPPIPNTLSIASIEQPIGATMTAAPASASRSFGGLSTYTAAESRSNQTTPAAPASSSLSRHQPAGKLHTEY
jgi:HAMP domain-containing protein